MPFYDLVCENGHEHVDQLLKIGERPPCAECGAPTETLWRATGRGQVIGDEIDVEIKHALCHPDGTPRRFRSRTELRRAEEAAGYTNYVVHHGSKGGDKSKHTTRWI